VQCLRCSYLYNPDSANHSVALHGSNFDFSSSFHIPSSSELLPRISHSELMSHVSTFVTRTYLAFHLMSRSSLPAHASIFALDVSILITSSCLNSPLTNCFLHISWRTRLIISIPTSCFGFLAREIPHSFHISLHTEMVPSLEPAEYSSQTQKNHCPGDERDASWILAGNITGK
jgi:hypothetical protein